MIRILTFSLLIHSAVIRPAGPAPTMRTSTLDVLGGDSPIFDGRKDLEVNEPIMSIFVRVLLVGRMNKTYGVVTPIYQQRSRERGYVQTCLGYRAPELQLWLTPCSVDAMVFCLNQALYRSVFFGFLDAI